MPQQPFEPVSGAVTRLYAPGEDAAVGDYEPGDFILTHGNTWVSRLIRVGQYLRFWGADRKYAWWNHAAMVISPDGKLIEALGAGVLLTHISRYKKTQYHLVRLGNIATTHDRRQAVVFARWCLGEKYGYLTIVSIALSLLTGGKFTFGFDGQSICSGLVARALERTDAIFNRSPSHTMPADLAKYFEVEPPDPSSDIGEIPPTPMQAPA